MGQKPKGFYVSIGGYSGPSYSVQLVRGELQYKSCKRGYSNWKKEIIPVTDEQWDALRATLDSLDVWQWEREYPNPGVCDGPHWDLDIVYPDRRIRSQGENNYPANEASESNEPENKDVFGRFIKAVQSLVGSRRFC